MTDTFTLTADPIASKQIAPALWRPVPGYEGIYEVSDAGEVRSLTRYETMRDGRRRIRRGRAIKLTPDSDGYRVVTTARDGVLRQRSVHSLVMLAFVGPRPNGHDIHHKNANRADNRLSNLEYLPASVHNSNQTHRGRVAGERNPCAKLNEMQVRVIRACRRLPKGWMPQHELAAIWGVSKNAIRLAGSGQTWREVAA